MKWAAPLVQALHGLVAISLVAAAPANSFQTEPVSEEIEAALARLRAAWPEVGRAEMRRGIRFEFRDGAILLGSDRIAQLRSSVDNPNNALLAFLLAHEAWHSVQHARHDAANIQRMKVDRTLECEADFMGAAATYRELADKRLPAPALRAARLAIMRYVVANTQAYAKATAYPSADLRAQTIAIGWSHAANPSIIRNLTAERPSSRADDDWAADICRIITHAGDASAGALKIEWANGEYVSAPLPQLTTLSVTNETGRPITLSFLVLGTLTEDEAGAKFDERDYDLHDIIEDTVTVPAKSGINGTAKFTRTYSLPQVADGQGSNRSFARLPYHAGGAPQHLLASRYADVAEPLRYCFEQATEPANEADRALLARLGIVALAADDDFRPIASSEFYDGALYRTVLIAPAYALNPRDWISQSPDRYSVYLTWREDDDASALMAERQRLIELFRSACGASSITIRPRLDWQRPSEETVTITRFAPKAAMDLSLRLPRTAAADGIEQAGTISFFVSRIPGQ